MRRPTLILSIISLVLGATTAWLAFELRAARQELATLGSHPAPAASAVPANSATLAQTRTPEASTTPVATVSAATGEPARPGQPAKSEMDAAQHAANLAHNSYVRALLEDPEKRAKALREHRKNHERELPRQVLDLGGDDYNRLLDTMAASSMRYAEAMYRCNQNPACDMGTAVRNEMQANRRELVELLGAERAQRLEDYRDNVHERNSVAGFRSELPDSQRLSDAQAEKLADVLGDERRRVIKEWEQQGVRYSGMSNMYGSLYFPVTTQDVEQRVTDATEYQRRQRDRAAQVLTSGQLEAFTKQQEQMLEIARGSWEYEQQQGGTK